MIHYVKGDIFESNAQVIVNPVNTAGVMGKGLALAFKNKYPHMFYIYKKACDRKFFDIGNLILVEDNERQILLFPTKKDWRNPSSLEYIEIGLKEFLEGYRINNITSIAFPSLGCGCGGLKWEDVKSLMEKYLGQLTIDIYIYEPT